MQNKTQNILNVLGCEDKELSILFVDDKQIKGFNRKYLNRSWPTNVISFPMQEGMFSDVSPKLLGDVVVSVETAQREAKNICVDIDEQIIYLLVHGILHLVGYDHEKPKSDSASEAEEKKMEAKTEEVLSLI